MGACASSCLFLHFISQHATLRCQHDGFIMFVFHHVVLTGSPAHGQTVCRRAALTGGHSPLTNAIKGLDGPCVRHIFFETDLPHRTLPRFFTFYDAFVIVTMSHK